MAKRGARAGDTVRVHYRGQVRGGDVFIDTFDKEPLEFTLGKRAVKVFFEHGVLGMRPGETKMLIVEAFDGYGHRREEDIINLARDSMPPHFDLYVGRVIQFMGPDGWITGEVIELTDAVVRVDTNHPLRGQDLVYDLELVELIEGEELPLEDTGPEVRQITVPAAEVSLLGAAPGDGSGNGNGGDGGRPETGPEGVPPAGASDAEDAGADVP